MEWSSLFMALEGQTGFNLSMGMNMAEGDTCVTTESSSDSSLESSRAESTANEQPDQKLTKRKTKHKPYNPYCPNGQRASMYVSKPRFFKNDQRRNYMNMLVNVYHASEENFTKCYFQTMWHPDAKYSSIERDVQTGQRALIRKLDRADLIADMWLNQQLSIQPDTRFKILEVQLVLRSDGTAAIRAKVIMEGTKIVIKQATSPPEKKAEDDDAQGPNLPMGETPKRTLSASSDECTSDGLVYNKHNPTETPNIFLMPFHFDGVVVLHLNADRLITEQEFIYNWNKPRVEVGKVEDIDELG